MTKFFNELPQACLFTPKFFSNYSWIITLYFSLKTDIERLTPLERRIPFLCKLKSTFVLQSLTVLATLATYASTTDSASWIVKNTFFMSSKKRCAWPIFTSYILSFLSFIPNYLMEDNFFQRGIWSLLREAWSFWIVNVFSFQPLLVKCPFFCGWTFPNTRKTKDD